MDLKEEWKKQIKRCEATIRRYQKYGWHESIPEIEKIKREAEKQLEKCY